MGGKPEVFVSIDIETDGPAPGVNSMLALGAAAFAEDGTDVGTWYSKLRPLTDGVQDESTMAWWQTQPEAWQEVNRNRRHANYAIPEFAMWVRELAGKPVAVAWPAAFDFAFVNYYCHRYTEDGNPLGFACLDIRSYANGLAGYRNYYGLRENDIKTMAGEIDKTGLRQHVAVDDAIEQGRLFMALRRYADNQSRREHG
jgi:3' exoribonuclease, RNase T-like